MTADSSGAVVVAADERSTGESSSAAVDVERWRTLAVEALDMYETTGELTLTFVDLADIAQLNEEHMGQTGPTDVLSFPLDSESASVPAAGVPVAGIPTAGIPTLLGDVVVSPAVAESQFPEHAGTFDDELALLVVHGVLHVIGHDHSDPHEAVAMREAELAILVAKHWRGPPPAGFRQTHI